MKSQSIDRGSNFDICNEGDTNIIKCSQTNASGELPPLARVFSADLNIFPPLARVFSADLNIFFKQVLA
jgi:hypothetical protein